MPTQRELFLNHLAQTSPSPLSLEIEKAEGIYLYDKSGKKYIDAISGISVSSLGHRHPAIVTAVKKQLDEYMHLMVYGEYIQTPQVNLAKMLAENLPAQLSCTYFTNSGSEATEGAMKLAKRYTGRSEIISFRNAYHGSTQGALSVMGNEELKNAFRPLLPDTRMLEFNSLEDLNKITHKTACVIAEPIQGEAGVILPQNNFLTALRNRCDDVGALLIFDEIQTGFGRTGKLFAFQHYHIIPDVLLLGKAMGGGMPVGAFISSKEIMNVFTHHPALGNLTTFGGHPVCCAAALANLRVLLTANLISDAERKEKLFSQLLVHEKIKVARAKGLFIALQFENSKTNADIIQRCINKGVIVDWFLFAPHCMRIAPPLIITEEEIKNVCSIISESINENKK